MSEFKKIILSLLPDPKLQYHFAHQTGTANVASQTPHIHDNYEIYITIFKSKFGYTPLQYQKQKQQVNPGCDFAAGVLHLYLLLMDRQVVGEVLVFQLHDLAAQQQ